MKKEDAHRLRLFQITLGIKSDKRRIEGLKDWDGLIIKYFGSRIELYSVDKKMFQCELSFSTKDMFSETHTSQFEDGENFRLVELTDFSLHLVQVTNQVEGMIGICSCDPDSWAVHYFLVSLEDKRTFDVIVKEELVEQAQKLVNGCIMSLTASLDSNFLEISKRLLRVVSDNPDLINELRNGTVVLDAMKNNINLYSKNERALIISSN